MPPTMRPRGDVIRELRERGGDTLRSLSVRAGINAATLYRIEKGASLGRPASLRAIADGLGVPLPVIVESTELVA